MNISLLSILHNKKWDFRPDMAQDYANGLRNAIEMQLDNDIEKQHGYFLSRKGYKDKDGRTVGANFEDKLYVGNIHRIEDHLYWNDEQLQDDDQIINVVVVDGPVTRDGGGCSYGSKDWRDQVMYANTIPQVVGHLFVINTPGGEAACRNDYEMMVEDCRKNNKPTVGFVDGMCCSSGVNLASRLDRVIVMNPRDEFGCIGTMAAFWAVAHDTVDQDGYRYVELVGKDCPEKNAWWREAAKGEYEKLQADLDLDTEQFHATVREGRPLVTDDMLSGKVFEAQDVIPALVDEIGDMDRAIECVFALANEEMKAARLVTAPDPAGEGDPEPQEDPQESTHQIENSMTDEEKKAQEAAAAQAAEQEAKAKAQEAEAQAAEEGAGEGAQEGAGEGVQEGAGEGAQEGAQEGAGEGAQEGEGSGEGEGAGEGSGEGEGEGAGEGEGSGEGEGESAQEGAAAPASQEAQEAAKAELDKITETLHNAEQMIADKDKEIADLKAAIDQKEIDFKAKDETIEKLTKDLTESNTAIEGLKNTIDSLNKQVADLKAEVKELSDAPAPMVDAGAGVPAGNGTGDAPKQKTCRIKRGMNYKEIREAMARE